MMPRNRDPERPVPAVGAIVFRDGAVLLVTRGTEPGRGRWSVPGGAIELGETAEQAAARETLEETGVVVRPIRVVDVFDYIERGDSGRVKWHYVLIDLLCDHVSGEPAPATDAENARFVPLRDLAEYDITPTALAVLETASKMRSP
jgi:ADP-ribose pyrophosphatase